MVFIMDMLLLLDNLTLSDCKRRSAAVLIYKGGLSEEGRGTLC